jgi:integrase
MNEVQPIRLVRHINAMKKALHGRDLLLFVFGINSGLRISDILALKVGDIRGRDFISVKETKTDKPKRFVLNKAIKDAIKQTIDKDTPDSEYVFKSRKGVNKPISRVQAYRILNDAAERAKIADKVGAFGTHTLRKTFGYHAHKKGTSLPLLQSIFNHSSQAVTLRYIGLTQDHIDDVYTNINL